MIPYEGVRNAGYFVMMITYEGVENGNQPDRLRTIRDYLKDTEDETTGTTGALQYSPICNQRLRCNRYE